MELISNTELQSLVDNLYGSVQGCGETVSMTTITVVPSENPNLHSPTRITASIPLNNPMPIMRNISVQEVIDSKGTFQQGDRSFYISATTATPDQIHGATEILYGSQRLKIVQRKEGVILGGKVVNWEIVAGARL